MKTLFILAYSFILFSTSNSFAHENLTYDQVVKILKCRGELKCKGNSSYGGKCYTGYGGPLYAGYGGACYAGYGGPLYDGYGGALYAGYGGACYDGYGGACYSGYGGACSEENDNIEQDCPLQCNTVCN